MDGDLDVDVGRDLGLLGARVHAGGDADIDVANNLTIKTLQDISESSNFSAGLSVTVGPSGPTGGSANFAAGNSERQRSLDGLAALTAGGELDVDVDGTTEITGGIIGSESDQLDLTTTNLVLNDLTERERSRQVSLNASFNNSGPPSSGNTPPPINSTDSGGSEFNVGGFGGSFSSAALDGTTRATIGQGNITVTGQSEAATAAQLAGTNRDINNATTITRDTSFDTGNVFIDVGAARRVSDNLEIINESFDLIIERPLTGPPLDTTKEDQTILKRISDFFKNSTSVNDSNNTETSSQSVNNGIFYIHKRCF